MTVRTLSTSSTNLGGTSSVVSRVTFIRLMILTISRAVPEKSRLAHIVNISSVCTSGFNFDLEGDLHK